MKYSFKNLNKTIDRWIANKTNLAPDKDYTETFLREQYTDLVNNFEGFKNFTKNPHFQTAYHKYRIGDQGYLDKIFFNDDELIASKIFIPSPIKRYKIIDTAIKKELFKKIKEAITILEIKRKLDGLSDPLQKTNEKHKERMEIIYSDQPDFEMRKNNILPVFWNFFQRINNTNISNKKIKTELEQIVSKVSSIVAQRNLQYFILTTNKESAKKIFEEKIQGFFISPQHAEQQVETENIPIEHQKAEAFRRSIGAEENEKKIKEGEQKDRQDELKRTELLKKLIDETYDYSPTIEDFKQELAVQKINPESFKYYSWLRETKKIYSNANYYYTIWGARGTGIDRGELYTNILSLINEVLESLMKAKNEPIGREHNLNIFHDYIRTSASILRRWTRILRGYDAIDLNEFFDMRERGVKAEGSYFHSAESKEQRIFFIDNIIEDYDRIISEWDNDIHPAINNELQNEKYSDKNIFMIPGGRDLLEIITCLSERQQYWSKRKKDILLKDEKKVLPQQIETKTTGIPENPYPKIFTSYKGFQIFEAFKNEIVEEKTEYADYSFLFTKLKKDEFIHDMKHKKFIDFLSDSYNAKFASTYKQFKYSETSHKKKTYSRYKKQFQSDNTTVV